MATITSAISDDHRELVDYYKNILSAPDNDTATRWQNQFTWGLARHLTAGELTLYPVFENKLGAMSKIITVKDQTAHQAVSLKVLHLTGFQ